MTNAESQNCSPGIPPAHQHFIDWMKAVGMFLIVFGHVVGAPFNQFTQPIYPKQLGVAFFVFITAWSLANDGRSRWRILFHRLFPVYFYGMCLALLLSSLFFFLKDDTNPSNYLPFFLGINVLFNNFPANPTTWYVGTYLHLLLFWCFFLRDRTIAIKHVLFVLGCEIAVRSLFVTIEKPFVAYMLLPNWGTVFLLGFLWFRKGDEANRGPLSYLLPLWLGCFALWAYVTNAVGFDTSFPFRKLSEGFAYPALTQSLLVSFVYCLNTILFFAIARRLPALRMVSFFSRNTLIIFLAHMPLIYGLAPSFYSFFETTFVKKAVLICTLYVGLALISEAINKILDIKALKARVWHEIESKLAL